MKATDDSTNGMTVVDDSPTTVTWSTWINMTPEQQAAIPKALITGAPGLDGNLSTDLLTKLWENPSPTSAFAAQNITLSSSDYDMLIWISLEENNLGPGIGCSIIVPKGSDVFLNLCHATNGGSVSYRRLIDRTSDTVYAVDDNYSGVGATSATVDNSRNVPYQVYGFKKSINIDFSAIASDVSTSADKCMLTDGVTSVEDKVTGNALGTGIDIPEDGSIYTFPSDGYLWLYSIYGTTNYLYVRVLGSNDNNSIELNIAGQSNAASSTMTFVRKGMRTFYVGSGGTHYYQFYPIS